MYHYYGRTFWDLSWGEMRRQPGNKYHLKIAETGIIDLDFGHKII
jgi:hypothetical protein